MQLICLPHFNTLSVLPFPKIISLRAYLIRFRSYLTYPFACFLQQNLLLRIFSAHRSLHVAVDVSSKLTESCLKYQSLILCLRTFSSTTGASSAFSRDNPGMWGEQSQRTNVLVLLFHSKKVLMCVRSSGGQSPRCSQ